MLAHKSETKRLIHFRVVLPAFFLGSPGFFWGLFWEIPQTTVYFVFLLIAATENSDSRWTLPQDQPLSPRFLPERRNRYEKIDNFEKER